MGRSGKGRQQGRGTIEGQEGGGQDGREGSGPPPTTVEKMVDRGTRGKGARGNGGGPGGWEPGAP